MPDKEKENAANQEQQQGQVPTNDNPPANQQDEGGQSTPPQGVNTEKTNSQSVPYARFKEVNDKYNKLKAQIEAENRKRLEEQQKWQQLYEQTKKEYEELQRKAAEQERYNAVLTTAQQLNIIDPEAAFLFVKDKQIPEGKTVAEFVAEQLKALIEKKPYLVQKNTTGYKISGKPAASQQQGATAANNVDALSKLSMAEYIKVRGKKHK